MARSGDKFGGNVFGQLVDEHGAGLTVDGEPDVSNNNGALEYEAANVSMLTAVPKGACCICASYHQLPRGTGGALHDSLAVLIKRCVSAQTSALCSHVARMTSTWSHTLKAQVSIQYALHNLSSTLCRQVTCPVELSQVMHTQPSTAVYLISKLSGHKSI